MSVPTTVLLLLASANLILLLVVLARIANRSQGERLDSVRSDLKLGRDEARASAKELREEVSSRIHVLDESLRNRIADGLKAGGEAQQERLEGMNRKLGELVARNQESLDAVRGALDHRVKELQESNEKRLEEMRRTVDERLHETLEKRLGESFKLVSERLESVHKGLGEMQSLASGVGDLKRVLTNVKVRGTWGEVQLGAILEQLLTPDQFERNVCVREGSQERVEFAIRLPGPKDDPGSRIWLPIDSKFLNEDYVRLQGAAEAGDPAAVEAASDALLRAFRSAARDIRDKYVNPPATTDFAIMFLATEGLYAEALRQPAFVEELQQTYRVVVAGPTTVSAILSSLRMGFQTLAVEQRAAEVWRVLGGVKGEFGKFGTWLAKVQRHLQTATRTIEETGTRTRAMERRLRSVEQLGSEDSATILKLPGMNDVEAAEPGEAAEADDEESSAEQPHSSGLE
ncbi:MAG: DNA recombination protein RmuC [Steroidobacteraceae bacterium]